MSVRYRVRLTKDELKAYLQLPARTTVTFEPDGKAAVFDLPDGLTDDLVRILTPEIMNKISVVVNVKSTPIVPPPTGPTEPEVQTVAAAAGPPAAVEPVGSTETVDNSASSDTTPPIPSPDAPQE